MRSIWSGVISVSVINLPMSLGSTTKKGGLDLKMVRMSDGSPIKFPRVAEADGKEVPSDKIGKGYYTPDGTLVVLSDQEVKDAYGKKNRVAELVKFTDASNVPPMAVKSTYWVEPKPEGAKTYALLAAALQQTGKIAILKFAMRDRVNVAVLRAYDGYLALESLEWDADLVRPDFAAPAQTATEDEMDLALTLIETMTSKYDHAAELDTSREQVMAVIDAKVKTNQVIAPPARPDNAGASVNLADQLRASVEAQKPKEGEPKPVPAQRAQRKTTTRRKATV
jgi:DNA end-binding protein Ku